MTTRQSNVVREAQQDVEAAAREAESRTRRLLRRVDAFQQHRSWAGFPFAVARKFGEDQAGNLAALVAYYAFFSLFPLLLVFVTVLGFVTAGHPRLQEEVFSTALNEFPVIGGRVGEQVHALTGNGLALAVGIAGALWGGLGVASAVQTALNSIWEVPMVARPGFLTSTVRSLLLLLVGGAAILLTSAGNGLATGGAQYGLHLGVGLRVLAALAALVVNSVVFTLAFRALTPPEVTTRDIWPGAVLAAVAWQVLQLLGGYYIAHTLKGAGQTYGTFAVVIGLLSWLYLQAQLTLVAAEVDVVRKYRLWPRALLDPPQTDADRRAYRAYARTQRYQPEEHVDATFSTSGDRPGGG